MKTLTLNASLRENVGKKDSNKLRRTENVPCVLYGGKENVHFHVVEKDLKDLVYTSNVYAVNLQIADKEYKSIMKDIQFHPVTDRILHLDFLEIQDNKPITVELPIHLVGNSIGVKKGGHFVQSLRKVKVKGLSSAFPDYIEINIENLDIGQAIRVSDLNIEGIQFLTRANSIITAVKTARVVVEEVPEVVAEVEKEGEAKKEDAK